MISQNSLLRAMPTSFNPLAGVREPFFVHAGNLKAPNVARICANDSLGAIYTIPIGNFADRLVTLRKTIQIHVSIAGVNATVLADANQYSGNNRLRGTAPLSLDWVDAQWDAGLLWATTDSGYVDRDDVKALETLLQQAEAVANKRSGNLLTMLPLDYYWISQRPDQLRILIERYGLTVGLLLGASGDPLASKDAVQGLVHVLGSSMRIALLRTDLSAVGALAAGASMAAMGITSSLRHIYPPSTGKGYRPPSHPSALVPQALSLHRVDTLARAIALSREGRHWQCECDRCQGRTLDWILDSDDAFEHNIYGAADLVRNTISVHSVADSLVSWAAKCEQAQFVHMDIEATTQSGWNVPSFINAWRNVRQG